MGTYDKSRFKQVIVPLDVYLRLLAKKKGNIDSLGEVIRRLLDEADQKPGNPTAFSFAPPPTTLAETWTVPQTRRQFASTKLKISE